MYQPQAVATFEAMVIAVGTSASETQISRLVDWMRENIAPAYVRHCADIAIEHGPDGLYTDISEYMGESGI